MLKLFKFYEFYEFGATVCWPGVTGSGGSGESAWHLSLKQFGEYLVLPRGWGARGLPPDCGIWFSGRSKASGQEVKIAGAGHLNIVEHPAGTARAITDFIAAVRRPG